MVCIASLAPCLTPWSFLHLLRPAVMMEEAPRVDVADSLAK